ncbi:MAG: DUF554 domain-containing protein [Candidatus Celaenobacter antarcticus]|nr:DUF554 domain-containing protein [Candidatus Celaenobacter antarcticus]MDP8313582.1 DUF554 domain-containing protein [Candidatus Celaenobacter antarcticus]
MIGTFVNVGAVIVGSIIGIILRKKLPEKLTTITFQAIGLFTIFLGITMALKTEHYLILIFSLILGSIIGELLNIDAWLTKMSNSLKKKWHSQNDKFSEGLVTAFLLFCMGSMTILGAIEEGLGGNPNLLLTKSLLDGVASIALAAALGIGVMLSVIPLLIYQGGLTLFAKLFEQSVTIPIINELTAVGGIILIGLGITILEIKKLKVINMLPSLFIVVVLTIIFV